MTEPGGAQDGIEVTCCTLFFSYFRLEMTVAAAPIGFDPAGAVLARIVFGPTAPPQKLSCLPVAGGWRLVGEALVEPDQFPAEAAVALAQDGRIRTVPVETLLQRAAGRESHPLMREFIAATAHRAGQGPRPSLLDIGGRARSGIQRSLDFPHCDVTTFDILPAAGVDVVGDAHELSRHFPHGSFDFAMSVAVFEHLAMPWKVAVEMARVLRPGGLALVFTHQTIGMHDLPWDFFRFSDAAWSAIFNRYTGFEIVATRLSAFMHIVPRAWTPRHRGAEAAGGFEGSAVLVRCIAGPLVDWPVRVPDILATSYPAA